MSLNRRKSIYLCGNANKFGAGTGTDLRRKFYLSRSIVKSDKHKAAMT